MSTALRLASALATVALATVSLATVSLAKSPLAARQDDEPTVEHETARLLRSIRGDEPREPSDVLGELAAAIAPDLEPVLRILAARRVPGVAEGERDQKLSIYQRQLALDALAALPPARVRSELARVLRDDGEPDERAAKIRVLGACGSGHDLGQMLLCALPDPRAPQPLDDEVADALTTALATLLGRDAPTMGGLEQRYAFLDDRLVPSVLQALGETQDHRALALLHTAVKRADEHLLLALAQVRRAAPSPSAEADAALAATIRPFLDRERPTHCRAAALALGQLEDALSVERLIVLLSDEDAGLAANALWALRRITQLGFPAAAHVWEAWYAEERRWQRAERADVLRDLQSLNRGESAAAIRELSRRRLDRAAIARQLSTALAHPYASSRLLACRALAEVGSRRELPALVGALDDEDATVREAAYAALRALSPHALPPDAQAWDELVAREGW